MKTMKITTFTETYGHPLTVKELTRGYVENTSTGERTTMNGLLNITPPYQREFVYEQPRRDAVITTILEGCPLNVIYLAKLDDGKLEVIDGQQRITSICKFVKGQFSVEVTMDIDGNKKRTGYDDLQAAQEAFNNYELMVFVCEGDNASKMKWFRRINIAGVKLTEQELRNANYHGTWVTDAKKYFSRLNGLAMSTVIGNRTYKDYVDAKGGGKDKDNPATEDTKSVARQYLLEKVLGWACDADDENRPLLTKKVKVDIDEYMGKHYRDEDAKALWRYYDDVITWVSRTFPTYRRLMQGVEWGLLYNRFKDVDKTELDEKVNEILETEEISNEKYVYEAVLSGNMNLLQARAFPEADRKRKYKEQDGICPICGKKFAFEDMAGDHIVPWSKGGKTIYENLQMLCKGCNAGKSDCAPIEE